MDIQSISLIITIILALAGYIITHQQQLRLMRRQERLALINKRLDEFYGPLFVSTQAGQIAFSTYFKNAELQQAAQPEGDATTDSGLGSYRSPEWRLWVETVLMPLNLISEKVILEKSYLIREEEMPACLLQFVAHVASFRRILKKWKQGDFSETTVLITFPTEMNEYVARSYRELKREQLLLIERLQLNSSDRRREPVRPLLN